MEVRTLKEALARNHLEGELAAEAYILLMAIDHVLRYPELYRRRAPRHRAQLTAAVRVFEQSYKAAADLRDVLEHVEEYALGGGRHRQRFGVGEGDVPGFALDGPSADAEILFRFGTHTLPVKAAGVAAQILAAKLVGIWGEVVGNKTWIEPS
jgi:hypothetical protein